VYTHRADRTQEAEDSNPCKQRKHGNRAQALSTTRKQSLLAGMGRASAGRCRACAHDGHTRAWCTHAMNIYAQRALLTSTWSTSMQQAICEHKGSAGVWIWANLVSLWCIMVHLPCQHVERLAILSAENRFCLAPCPLRPTSTWCAWDECRSAAPATLLVCTCHCQSLAKVPRFRAGRLHVVGGAWAGCVPGIFIFKSELPPPARQVMMTNLK